MDSKLVVLISLIALTLIASVAGLFSSAYVIKQMNMLESKVDYLYQESEKPEVVAPAPTETGRLAGKTLATSPDNNFIMYGFGSCEGEYRVNAGTTTTLFDGTYYELYHPITIEDSDLGAVAVQTSAQYEAKPAYPKVAFRTDTHVVSYTMKELSTNECMVGITQPQ